MPVPDNPNEVVEELTFFHGMIMNGPYLAGVLLVVDPSYQNRTYYNEDNECQHDQKDT